MATIKTFEDIVAWQKAKELTLLVYKYSNSGMFSGDPGLRDQVRRAAVSLISNIAEGFERGGRKEFIQYLAIAKGSAGELRAQLDLAYALGYLLKEDSDKLKLLCLDVSKLIYGLITYLNQTDYKGIKYKVDEPEMEYFTTWLNEGTPGTD